MKICQVTDNTFYFDFPSTVGLFRFNTRDCCLIDSGEKLDQVKEMANYIETQGYKVKAILSTHFHPDHCFGHSWWQQHASCAVLASFFDAMLMEAPYLSPYSLYGAHPPKVLNNRFLLAPACQVNQKVQPGIQIIEGYEFLALDLPGHTPGHLGWVTPDGVLFAGDALLAPEVIKNTRLNYTADVLKHINTLGQLALTTYSQVVVSHGGRLHDFPAAIKANQEAMDHIIGFIRGQLLQHPLSIEDVLAALVSQWHLPLNTSQYFLYRATISACLAYLCDRNEALVRFSDGRMLFSGKR